MFDSVPAWVFLVCEGLDLCFGTTSGLAGARVGWEILSKEVAKLSRALGSGVNVQEPDVDISHHY